MKVIDIINQNSKTIFSFELLPPLKGNDSSKIYNTVETLLDFDPKYINITTHRDEMVYVELPDGHIEKSRDLTICVAKLIVANIG